MKKLLPVLGCLLLAGRAHGDATYTYVLDSSKATITGFVSGVSPSGAVVIPATVDGYTVTALGHSAFKDRTTITAVSFASGSSAGKIGAGVFQGCTGLQTAVLPSGVTIVSSGAFQGCTSLTSVTLPSTLTGIGAAAFADCRKLTALSLPSGLTSLDEAAFLNCRSLGSLTIPAGVTQIPARSLSGCSALTSLTLPEGVTAIGAEALKGCTGLTSLTLPAATAAVGDRAFKECSGLTALTLSSSLTGLGDQAFEGCGSLAEIDVPSGNPTFSSAGGVLFDHSGATLLKCPEGKTGSYSIPASVTALTQGAFSHCDQLEEVSVPSGITRVAEDAFYYASGSQGVTLAGGVSEIGAWAFAGCTGIGHADLPATITKIEDSAFFSAGLDWALFRGNAPTIGASVFDGEADGFTIYYLSGSTGFSSPTWQGYAATGLNSSAALISWLASNGFSPVTDALSDPDGDGVNLLLAYALGLDPNSNPAGGLPQPVFSNGSLSLTFQGNAEGITYSAQVSSDLSTWTTDGVTLSGPDASGLRTAAISSGDGTPLKFMRLVVGN